VLARERDLGINVGQGAALDAHRVARGTFDDGAAHERAEVGQRCVVELGGGDALGDGLTELGRRASARRLASVTERLAGPMSSSGVETRRRRRSRRVEQESDSGPTHPTSANSALPSSQPSTPGVACGEL
jgi:hypothetical protein